MMAQETVARVVAAVVTRVEKSSFEGKKPKRAVPEKAWMYIAIRTYQSNSEMRSVVRDL